MKITTTLTSLLIFIGTQLFAQDAYLTDLSIANYLKVNNSYNISIDIQNNSETAFSSCSVSWQLTGGSVNTDQVNIGGGGLITGYYVAYTFSSTLTLPSSGSYVLKVWVTVSGDPDLSNDTLTQNILGLTSYAQGNVLVEELTGCWCPHCPPGMIAIDAIAQNPNAIVASFHGGSPDNFVFEDGVDHMAAYFPTEEDYFPSAIVNMGEMGAYAINSYTGNWEADADAQIGVSPVALTVTASYASGTQLLTVTVTANFKYALTGDFYLNAYVLQNNVPGEQDSSDYEVSWVYNHLARAMLGGQNGTGGVIPSSPALNTDYSKTYTMTIPSAWNVTDIKDIDIDGIVFQQSGSNTNALNAAKYSFATGVDNIASENGNIHIFPNPISSSASIAVAGVTGKINYTFMLYDVLGNEVKRLQIQNDVTVLKRDDLSSGIYFYNIIDSEGTIIGNGKLIMAD